MKILNEWILESDISLIGESSLEDPDVLFNTRVTLGIGDLRVKDNLFKVGEIKNWISLIHWCTITDESECEVCNFNRHPYCRAKKSAYEAVGEIRVLC